MSGHVSLRAQTVQLRADAKDEGWGNRQQAQAEAQSWFEHDGGANTDDVVLYDGSSASVVQPQGALTNIGADRVRPRRTGATPGHVIAAWRRTDFGWISTDGGAPVAVTATNPGNPLVPLNPEGAGIAEGCVFLILQDASGAFPRKYVFKANPATGAATILTDPATYRVSGSADRGATDHDERLQGGLAVFRRFLHDQAPLLRRCQHLGDRLRRNRLASHRAQGMVYAQQSNGVSQVYDSNLASPAAGRADQLADPSKVNSYAKPTAGTSPGCGRTRTTQTGGGLILNGNMPLTDSGQQTRTTFSTSISAAARPAPVDGCRRSDSGTRTTVRSPRSTSRPPRV